MTKIDTVKVTKKNVYVCWNDEAHAGGMFMWEAEPIAQDKAVCPECGEVVRITQKL